MTHTFSLRLQQVTVARWSPNSYMQHPVSAMVNNQIGNIQAEADGKVGNWQPERSLLASLLSV